ncbi:MAG: hypothetical protein LBB74_09350 [Chitinispirillales bacterium]|jgi:hypothetical protein|nr:hypothetical protein [Chitinispirillales bacterium]
MYKFFLTTVITALCLFVCGCSGGFGSDGIGADEFSPGIFGPDTIAE